MPELSKIFPAEAQQGRAIHLGVPTDVVMDTGMKFFAVLVVPGFMSFVLRLGKDSASIPVVFLARQIAASLQDQNPLTGRRQGVGQSAAPGTGTNNDHVVVVFLGYGISSPSSGQARFVKRCQPAGSVEYRTGKELTGRAARKQN